MVKSIDIDLTTEPQSIDIDLTKDDEEEDKKVEPVKRDRGTDPFNTFKQALAGPLSLPPDLVSLLGMAGAGIEGGVRTMMNDRPFMENFERSAETGIDKALLNVGLAGRGAVNELFNITEPKLLEDQLARGITESFLPGVGWLGALAKAPGKLAGLGRLLTPVMKMTRTPTGSLLTKGNVIRGGAQIGVGLGADQAGRAVFPSPQFPLMFSEAAITGQPESIDIDMTGPVDVETDTDFGDSATIAILRDQDEKSQRELEKENVKTGAAMIFLALASGYGARHFAKNTAARAAARGPLGSADANLTGVEQIVKDVSEADLKRKFGVGYDGIERYIHENFADANQAVLAKLISVGASDEAILKVTRDFSNNWQGVGQAYNDTGRFGQGVGNAFDTDVPIRELINRIISLDSTTPKHTIMGSAEDFTEVGGFQLTDRQLFDLYILGRSEQSNRVVGDALDILIRAGEDKAGLATLEQAFKQSHTDDMAKWLNDPANKALIDDIKVRPTDEEIIRYKATDDSGNIWDFDDVKELQSGLYSKELGQRITNTQLDEIIGKAGRRDEFTQITRDITKITDGLLSYMRKLDLIDDEGVKLLKRRFTLNEESVYIPFMPANSPSSWTRLKQLFGFITPKAEEAAYMENLLARGVTHGAGTKHPVPPLESLQRYSSHIIEHTNTSAHQMNLLKQMAKVEFRGDDVGGMYHTKLDDGKIAEELDPKIQQTNRNRTDQVQYIGDVEMKNMNKDHIEIRDVMDDGRVKATNITRDQADVIWVQHKGKMHAFRVPDIGVRAGIKGRPNLTGGQEFNNYWKNVFTEFTTGSKSGFFLAANQFSAQTIALNSIAKQGATGLDILKVAGRSNVDSIRGTFELIKTGMAKELSDYLSQRLFKQLRMTGKQNQTMLGWKQALERRFGDSIAMSIQGQTGKTSTSIASTDNIAGSASQSFGKYEGNFLRAVGLDQMTLAWRMWKAFNVGWHEGPALGVQMRHIGAQRLLNPNMTPEQFAEVAMEANRVARDLAGDMQKMGSSQAAVWFNSSVPFSAAMIQSWSAIGSAAKANPKAFIAGAGAIIGAPTIMEITWNTMMSDPNETYVHPGDMDEFGNPKPGAKRWTHIDWYWNGLTKEQRVGNSMIMINGRPPWNPILYPISPEWGLFRSIVIDGIDTAFGLSHISDPSKMKAEEHETIAGFARAFDLPIPTIYAAAYTAISGQDLRAGVIENQDGSYSAIKGVPLGTGQRALAGQNRETKIIQGGLTKRLENVILEIYGAGGAAMTAFTEAFVKGFKGKEGTVLQGLERGVASLGMSAQKQFKVSAPLFRVFNQSASDATADEVRVILSKVKELIGSVDSLGSKGFGNNTVVYQGDALLEAAPNDPVWIDIAQEMKGPEGLKALIKNSNKEISGLTLDNNIWQSSARRIDSGTRISEREAQDRVNANNLKIKELRQTQRAMIHDFKLDLERKLNKRYRPNGPPITIDFESLKQRPKF